MKDPVESVLNVLKTINESVVNNINVPKTTKVKIFNARTTKPLIDLYKWTGPIGKKRVEVSDDDVNIEQRNQVKNILHSLILTLCTSKKYGVIFNEKMKEADKLSNNFINMRRFTSIIY